MFYRVSSPEFLSSNLLVLSVYNTSLFDLFLRDFQCEMFVNIPAWV